MDHDAEFEWPVNANESVRASGKDGPQIIETKAGRWNAGAETVFLNHLACSCNITASAKRAGLQREAIYYHKRKDNAFAERCKVALAQGYERIESLLIRRAEDSLSGVKIDPDSPIPPMTISEAINLLKLHRPAMDGDGPGPYRWRLKPADPDAALADILDKVAAVRRAKNYE